LLGYYCWECLIVGILLLGVFVGLLLLLGVCDCWVIVIVGSVRWDIVGSVYLIVGLLLLLGMCDCWVIVGSV
jgi:hypothetical protein